MPIYFRLICLLFLVQNSIAGQEVIRLLNPSFEFDSPNQPGQLPMFWENFGSASESPPDLQPGFFECEVEPFDGHTSVGLVVRDNGTVEAIGQKLEKPLTAGHVYHLSVALMRSPKYFSQSRKTGAYVNFNEPVALMIYGIGQENAENAIVLAKSEMIANEFWEVHHFDLRITEFDCHSLVFRAAYPNKDAFCNGNLMIDRISDIVSVEHNDAKQANVDPVICEKQAISFTNPSFESLIEGGLQFVGWEFLVKNSPIPERCLENAEAAEGSRFLTLTTAVGERFSKVFTKIDQPMCRGVTYNLSLKARHCPPKRKPFQFAGMTLEMADHKGCFLRVLGVDAKNGVQELLATVGPVTNAEWEKIDLVLTPKFGNLNAIILQAWNDQSRTGNGTRSVFIDDLSPISPKN